MIGKILNEVINMFFQESEENKDFIGSMGHLQSGLITNDDASEVLKCIARYISDIEFVHLLENFSWVFEK